MARRGRILVAGATATEIRISHLVQQAWKMRCSSRQQSVLLGGLRAFLGELIGRDEYGWDALKGVVPDQYAHWIIYTYPHDTSNKTSPSAPARTCF